MMARRRIGQERLAVVGLAPRGGTSLDEVAALVDWTELDRLLAGISALAKGALGWPPLALFRALLLATWHDLSDVRLADALDDRASFRRFCGFAAGEATPERTAFVRFRAELVRRGLDRALFEAITRQLDARGLVVRMGSLMDATLIPSANIPHDGEAKWAGHRSRKPIHGYKAHVATDQEAGLIRGIEVTTANVHDAAQLDAILPDAPGDTYGDSAVSGSRPEAAIRARGGTPRIVHTGTWGGAEALARLEVHNAEVRRVRARIGKVFGTCKRSYGVHRMRWLDLAGPRWPAGSAHGDRLQPAQELAPARGHASMSHARTLPAARPNTPQPGRSGVSIAARRPIHLDGGQNNRLWAKSTSRAQVS